MKYHSTNHHINTHIAVLGLVLFVLLNSATLAVAEKFVISAKAGYNIVVLITELKSNNQITLKQIATIPIEFGYDAYNTTVVSRKSVNGATFDVYYPVATEYDGPITRLILNRFNSNLFFNFEQEFEPFPFDAFMLDSYQLKGPLGLSQFLVSFGSEKFVAFRITSNGIPGSHILNYQSGLRPLDGTVADDGKMIAVTTEKGPEKSVISIQKLHPFRKSQKMQTSYIPMSLTLSNPIRISSKDPKKAITSRFLFFKKILSWDQPHSNEIMMQKINDSTGEFIGTPKLFIKTEENTTEPCCVTDPFQQPVSVARNVRVVFFTVFDDFCKKYTLKAQVFDPYRAKKIGDPQLILGCDELPADGYGFLGMDVAEFE